MGVMYRAGSSLLVGVLCFLIVGASVTVGLVPWIELSLMLGIPMGASAGLTALFSTYTALEYRAVRATGTISQPVIRRLWTAAGATVTYVFTTAVGFALFFFGNALDGLWVLLFGLPMVVLAGALLAYIAARVTNGAIASSPAPPQNR